MTLFRFCPHAHLIASYSKESNAIKIKGLYCNKGYVVLDRDQYNYGFISNGKKGTSPGSSCCQAHYSFTSYSLPPFYFKTSIGRLEAYEKSVFVINLHFQACHSSYSNGGFEPER